MKDDEALQSSDGSFHFPYWEQKDVCYEFSRILQNSIFNPIKMKNM